MWDITIVYTEMSSLHNITYDIYLLEDSFIDNGGVRLAGESLRQRSPCAGSHLPPELLAAPANILFVFLLRTDLLSCYQSEQNFVIYKSSAED